MCFDYHQLNAKIIPYKYHGRHTDDTFDNLKSAKVFSVIDLKTGYIICEFAKLRAFVPSCLMRLPCLRALRALIFTHRNYATCGLYLLFVRLTRDIKSLIKGIFKMF